MDKKEAAAWNDGFSTALRWISESASLAAVGKGEHINPPVAVFIESAVEKVTIVGSASVEIESTVVDGTTIYRQRTKKTPTSRWKEWRVVPRGHAMRMIGGMENPQVRDA